MSRQQRRYGWVPDLPDHRDRLFLAREDLKIPPMKNLAPLVRVVYDQGDLGSCTANAIGQAIMISQMVEAPTRPVEIPSRLFVYYNERAIEGTVNEDAGAMIRDGIKSVALQGACLETTWPYQITKFATKPTFPAYNEGLTHKVTGYLRIPQSLKSMKNCLAAGYPFVFGFSVYESFESSAVATSGNAPLPDKSESQLGGHAVTCIGFNDGPDVKLLNGQHWPANTWLAQNSWGRDWGLKDSMAGCFTLPYAYLTDPNLADDFWTIRTVVL